MSLRHPPFVSLSHANGGILETVLGGLSPNQSCRCCWGPSISEVWLWEQRPQGPAGGVCGAYVLVGPCVPLCACVRVYRACPWLLQAQGAPGAFVLWGRV